jgi:hypothetical protein
MTLRKTILRKTKKKSKKCFTTIDLPIYGGWVMVSINQTDTEFLKSYMKERGITDVTAAQAAVSCVQQEVEQELGKTAHFMGNCMIRVYSELTGPVNYNTLVHELFHATDFMLDYRGLKLVDGSDEAYSYLIGYLMEKTMEAYK